MLRDDFIEMVLNGHYVKHPQGDILIEMDLDAVIAEAQTEKENSENSCKLNLEGHENEND